MRLISRSPEQTRELGKALGKLAQWGDVFLLVGNLGVGKTCLTQGIAWGLGISEYTMSPSFVIVREYQGRLPLYHMDLYRLENVAEVADLGLDEYFYGRGVSIVEWADRAIKLLPEDNLTGVMEYVGVDERAINLKANGGRYKKLVSDLYASLERDWSEWNWQ
ncbi:MAG: tRNA (adenosine(37)-N6)-threonylcarbamoyltransferase complex ATPase subunit type 1 TsaE [Chloroflexota bacterium]